MTEKCEVSLSLGMHKECYRRWTANTKKKKEKRLAEEEIQKNLPNKRTKLSSDASSSSGSSRRSGKYDRVMLFTSACIFCGRVKKKTKWTSEQSVMCTTKSAEIEIKAAVENDEKFICMGRKLTQETTTYRNSTYK